MKLMYLFQNNAKAKAFRRTLLSSALATLAILPSMPSQAASHAPGLEAPPFSIRKMAPFINDHTVVLGATLPVWEDADQLESANGYPNDNEGGGSEPIPDCNTGIKYLPTSVSLKPASYTPQTSVLRQTPMLLAMNETKSRSDVSTNDFGKDANAPRVTAIESATPRATKLTFVVTGGDRLSAVLTEFVKANGMSMQWNSPTDYVIQHSYTMTRKSFQETLQAILSPYGLSATIWEGNNVVEIYARTGEAQ